MDDISPTASLNAYRLNCIKQVLKQRSERQKQRNTAIENSKIARVNAYHQSSYVKVV